jgi:hypothetical protein
MQLRCDEGDLAMITRDEPGCEANVGRIVRILRMPAWHCEELGWVWQVRPVTSRAFYCVGENGQARLAPGWGMTHPDAGLMPITPPHCRQCEATSNCEGADE